MNGSDYEKYQRIKKMTTDEYQQFIKKVTPVLVNEMQNQPSSLPDNRTPEQIAAEIESLKSLKEKIAHLDL